MNILNLLRSVLKGAIEDNVIDVSPATHIVLPRQEQMVEDFDYLEPAEVELLRTAELPLRSHAAYLVAVYGGLRAGELWGLRWHDVLENELIVRHSRKRGTKSGKVRRVPLLEPARDALDRWGRGRVRRGLVWGGPDGNTHADGYDAGWAHRSQGRPGREYTQLGHRWKAGIVRRVPFKDLRHTCASHLLRGTWVERGWIERPLRMIEVSQWLGHESVKTTERYYARLAPGGLLDVVPRRAHLREVK